MYKIIDEILPASTGYFVTQSKFVKGAHQSIPNTGQLHQIGPFVLSTGMRVFSENENRYYQYDGAAWVRKESSNFSFTQSVAASSWIIEHNMEYRPNVYTVNGLGEEIVGQVVHSNVNSLSVNFSLEVSGTAWLS